MDNKYLEKIAGWTSKYEQVSGKNFSGSTNAEVLAGLNSSSRMSAVPTGDKVFKPGKSGFMGIGKSTTSQAASGATRMTGDALASGPNLAKRLANFKATKAALAAKSGTGNKILARATGLVKKHPLAAAGGALAVGLMAGRAAGSKQPQQPQYQGYM